MPLLFAIETDRVRLTWSRRGGQQPPRTGVPDVVPFGLHLHPLRTGVAPIVQTTDTAVPVLFEETAYLLFLQSLDGRPVCLRHRDPVLLQSLHASDHGRAVHGTVNFRSQVGTSRFTVEADGVPQFTMDVEVFPSKLDYRRDYEAIRDDVRDLAADLALEALRPTHTTAAPDARSPGGMLAWLALLHGEADTLEQALAYLDHRPHRGTVRSMASRRADRIRRVAPLLHRAAARGAGHGRACLLSGIGMVHEHLPTHAGRYTLDTPSHRWLAAHLHRLLRRVADAYEAESRRRPGPRRRALLDELDALRRRLVRLGRLGVLREADGPPPPEPPLRLLTAPGYREAYQSLLRLRRGIDLDAGPLALGLKDLHLLYEYWCFLTLARLTARRCGHWGALRPLLALELRGLRLRLRRGRDQTLRFPLPGGGRVTLTYNPRFGGPDYLVAQQPDVVLSVHPAGGAPRHYVLDAKYRLDASPGYVRRYGIPGPPTVALNDLHRYRDAIRVPVAQAVVLYPFREDRPGRYAASTHGRLLPTLGVGAIPLLPDATSHLETWLDGVVR